MAASESDSGEVVILADEDGEYYVVSKEVIERGKLEGDLKEAVVEAAENDVAGFSFSFGATRFEPIALTGNQGPATKGFQVIGSFQYNQPAGIQISRTLMPGR